MSAADGPRGALTRLLQLASPALPIGAYSYSSGLEAAIERGVVVDQASAFAWIRDVLELVLARFDAPLIAAAMGGGDLVALDDAAIAARETAELRLESTQMAFSLSQWIAQVAPPPAPDAATDVLPRSVQIAWAIAALRIGVGRDDAVAAWLWGFAENQVMVLIKALPIGQIAGQRMLFALGPVVDACARTACALPCARWSNAAPGFALASMRHERQYSRLFRS
ncbi:MAG: urease accessory protein UreF [Lautropia sp.]